MDTKSFTKTLLIQAAAVAIVVIGYLAWDADAVYEWLSGDILFGTPAEAACDLNQETCSAALPDGTPVTLSISPRPIPVMQKLQFEIAAKSLESESLKLEMYGLNMNMGRYTYTLVRDANGTYRGDGMIPSCVGQMQWRANIIAETPMQRVGTYFTFTTE